MSDEEREDRERVEALRRRLLDAVTEAVSGTDWAPPEGGFVAEAVVVMRWIDAADGDSGLSFVPVTTSFWATEGLLRGALRVHLANVGHDCDD